MEEFAEEIEADLQAHYRVDLRDLWRGGLSWRRCWVLVCALPPESATMTAMREAMTDEDLERAAATPKGDGPWSKLEFLVARLIDEVAFLRFQHAIVNSGKGKAPTPPELVKRPGVKARPRADPRLAAMLDIIRANRGGIPNG